MPIYNTACAETRTFDNYSQSLLRFTEALEWTESIVPPPSGYLNLKNIEDHKNRISQSPDQPAAMLWQTDRDYCDALQLPLSGKAKTVTNSLIFDAVTSAAKRQFVGISRDRNSYIGKRTFTHTTTKIALTTLSAEGLIYLWKMPPMPSGTGVCSFLTASPDLIQELGMGIITGRPPKYELDGRIIEVRCPLKQALAYPRTAKVIQMASDVRELNDFARSMKLTYSSGPYQDISAKLSKKSQVRIFNKRKGDRSLFKYGGRGYAGYQNVPKFSRPFILINGEKTAELDFDEIHA